MVDVPKEIHDFDKDPNRTETVVDMGNGFAVKLIKRADGSKREPTKIELPGVKKRLKRAPD
jgi:hypothetical protein